MIRFLGLCAGAMLLLGCQPEKPAVQDDQAALTQLVAWMSGAFSSEQQASQDDRYFHISLKMKPIWTEREDGHWLYVEQAVGTRPEQPYRQRIYRVTPMADGRFASAVYELPDPQAVIGAYEDPGLLADVTVADLQLRTGCAVILQFDGAAQYQGSTQDKACLSSLRGATYATSEVTITATGISSWDQGWDANDQQVWGATAGPYVFDRLPASAD
ncbi:chromophore lyase CpcT/CpeT [Marinicella meishanensis]|uniref:chromophore lyase CpcT/CpeT n=1 Tax=Marinicella meishanensis TaxID=2873263 RepID=UPI001CBE1707|nr:chromophore lyase CpcT/CpeT [Marinicella sp. NBU2979]